MMDQLSKIKILKGHYFVTISAGDDDDDDLIVAIVDSEAKEIFHCYSVKKHFKSIKEFINKIPILFKHFKVVILHLFHFHTSEYANLIEFRNIIKSKFELIQKLHFFMDEEDFFLAYLINSKIISVKIDEKLLYIYQCDAEGYGISEYLNTENGLKKIGDHRIYANFGRNYTKKFAKIFDPNTPPQIILPENVDSDAAKKFQRMMQHFNQNLKIFDITNLFPEAVVEAGKCILNHKSPQKNVIPSCVETFSIGFKINGNYFPLEFLVKDGETLPVTKNFYISKIYAEILIVYHDVNDQPVSIIDKLETFHDSHQTNLIFTLNEQNFPIYQIERHFIEDICIFPKTLNSTVKSKIPVIGFCDNFSVICVYKKFQKCYNFFGSLNGLLGHDLFVSFDQKEPKFGQKAMKMANSKPSCVIFDLINILSMSPKNITINPSWKFLIKKDVLNSTILIEFENFDGNRQTISPTFLMSMFLQEHLKAIKLESGKNPKKLGFWIFNNKFNAEQNDRIQNGLKDACKMLKIKCSFIDL